jgi:hypothetical protein
MWNVKLGKIEKTIPAVIEEMLPKSSPGISVVLGGSAVVDGCGQRGTAATVFHRPHRNTRPPVDSVVQHRAFLGRERTLAAGGDVQVRVTRAWLVPRRRVLGRTRRTLGPWVEDWGSGTACGHRDGLQAMKKTKQKHRKCIDYNIHPFIKAFDTLLWVFFVELLFLIMSFRENSIMAFSLRIRLFCHNK